MIAQQPAARANWDGWQFLIGDWKGEGSGDPGNGAGGFSLYPDLQNTVLVRKNHAEYPEVKDRPAFSHDDLMIIYQDGKSIRANYYDNETHVINYNVLFSPDSGSVIFTSDLIPSAPRFRLTYAKAENGSLKILFDVAPPGKPEEFSKYIEASAVRTTPGSSISRKGNYIPVESFDPQRNAAKDIEDAIVEATGSNRRIILDVGGNWCIWCKRLDTLFLKNIDLSEFMHKNYVVVKVNFSKENENEKPLSQYPEIKGYPHLFVLEKNGKLLHSQDTGDLESGKGHSKEKVFEFLEKWALSPVPPKNTIKY